MSNEPMNKSNTKWIKVFIPILIIKVVVGIYVYKNREDNKQSPQDLQTALYLAVAPIRKEIQSVVLMIFDIDKINILHKKSIKITKYILTNIYMFSIIMT